MIFRLYEKLALLEAGATDNEREVLTTYFLHGGTISDNVETFREKFGDFCEQINFKVDPKRFYEEEMDKLLPLKNNLNAIGESLGLTNFKYFEIDAISTGPFATLKQKLASYAGNVKPDTVTPADSFYYNADGLQVCNDILNKLDNNTFVVNDLIPLVKLLNSDRVLFISLKKSANGNFAKHKFTGNTKIEAGTPKLKLSNFKPTNNIHTEIEFDGIKRTIDFRISNTAASSSKNYTIDIVPSFKKDDAQLSRFKSLLTINQFDTSFMLVPKGQLSDENFKKVLEVLPSSEHKKAEEIRNTNDGASILFSRCLAYKFLEFIGDKSNLMKCVRYAMNLETIFHSEEGSQFFTFIKIGKDF